jgi:hypothetical protein
MFRKLPLALALTLSCAGPLVAQPTNAPHLRGLHDLLHLRSDQELAWQAFEQATAPGPQDASRHREAFRRMGSLPSPERMDL